MPHPQASHGCLVIMRFVIAARLHYQSRRTHRATNDARDILDTAGVHPPTNVPGRYGALGSPGAPLFLPAARPHFFPRMPRISSATTAI
jgi:hypothetical protein